MSRRKSNAHHAPVDIASMMRANRGPMSGSATDANAPQASQSIRAAEPNVSSRGLRPNVMPGGKQQYPGQQQDEGGLHLPPMPLTPTEQQRQKERERNGSNQKNQNGAGVSQYTKGREMYDIQPNYPVGKRPRDNSAGVQDSNSLNQQNRNYQNGMAAQNPPPSGNNQSQAQKMKMLYKKQVHSHRATSQTTAMNAGPTRDAQNLQTHRNAQHNP